MAFDESISEYLSLDCTLRVFDVCLDIVFIWDIDMLIILIWASNVDFYVLHCYISLVH